MFSCKCIQLIVFNTKLLYMFKNCCFVIHGALWTQALFGPIFGQGEGYYKIVLLYFISMQSANFSVLNIFNLCLCFCVDT